MKRYGLLAGPLAALTMMVGIAGLAQLVPGYSSIRQTISEIGEVDSPERMPFTVMAFVVAFLLLSFAAAVHGTAKDTGRSRIAAYFIGAMAISLSGAAIFAFPHPLHNVFGESELIAYLAPLVLAVTWQRAAGADDAVRFSWIMGVLVWLVIGANLTTIFRPEPLWHEIRPFYGVLQRSLFVTWFAWVAGLGFILYRRETFALAG